MAVDTTETTKVIGLGNDAATQFSFSPLVIFAEDEIVVTKVSSAGVETVLSLGTSSTTYSVTVSSYPGTGYITYPASGGTPLATGESIVIKRLLTLEQQTVLNNQGGYFPRNQEYQFDRGIMIDLQQQEVLDRSLRLPVGYTGAVVPETDQPAAGKYLRVNTGGTALEWVGISVADAAASDAEPQPLGSADAGTSADFSRADHVHESPATLPTAVADTMLLRNSGNTAYETKTAEQLRNAFLWVKGSDVASANDITLGTGNYFDITGTTTINTIATKGVGSVVRLHFDSALTLNDNGDDLVIGYGDIVIDAGGEVELIEYATAKWRVVSVFRADGMPVRLPLTLIDSGTLSGSTIKEITGIPAIYSSLILHVFQASSDTATRALTLYLSVDGGSNYSSADVYGASIHGTTGVAVANAGPVYTGQAVAAASSHHVVAQISGLQAGQYPQVIASGQAAGAGSLSVTSWYGSTALINALKIGWNDTGDFDAGNYVLYGVR